MNNPVEYQRKELWRKKYPTVISALLSILQLFLTLVILGCEVGGSFVNFWQMNVFVGYWTFPIFMLAWISLAGASCCCRIRCCGITTLIFQCLAIPMAICIIGFDTYFLKNPTLCFFSTCSSYYSGYSYSSSYTSNSTLYSIKVPLVSGQLAAGAVMLAVCVVYIIIFAVTTYRVQNGSTLTNGPQAPVNIIYPAPYPSSINSQVAGQNPRNNPSAVRLVAPPVELSTSSGVPRNQLICPNCRSRFQVSTTLY